MTEKGALETTRGHDSTALQRDGTDLPPINVTFIENAYFGILPDAEQTLEVTHNAAKWWVIARKASVWAASNLLALTGLGVVTSVQDCGTYLGQLTSASDAGLKPAQIEEIGSWLTHRRCGEPSEVLRGREPSPAPNADN